MKIRQACVAPFQGFAGRACGTAVDGLAAAACSEPTECVSPPPNAAPFVHGPRAPLFSFRASCLFCGVSWCSCVRCEVFPLTCKPALLLTWFAFGSPRLALPCLADPGRGAGQGGPGAGCGGLDAEAGEAEFRAADQGALGQRCKERALAGVVAGLKRVCCWCCGGVRLF